MTPSSLRRTLATTLAGLATLAALTPTSVLAQSSPYYIGVAQSLAYDSNLYRLGGDTPLPASVKSRSDTSYTTSLVAGIDQTWGRQRLNGSGSLRTSRFTHNDQLNNNGYGLNLGLDWSTVERLSGNLSVNANRSLRRFDPTEQSTGNLARNVEDNHLLSGTVRLGVVTRLTAEATLSRRTVRFSSDAYNGSEYNQGIGSLGLRYRLGGATTVGAAWRQGRVTYVTGTDPYDRRDLDLSANWDPSALTNVYARLSHSRTDHDQQPLRNFSGVTGELRGSTRATGKLKLSTRLSRDTGQSYSTFDFSGFTSAAEFNRTTTALRFGADYDFSAKIAFNASVDHARRNLSSVLGNALVSLDGSDRTNTLALGARWTPIRAAQLGCDLTREQRSASAGSSGVTVGRGYGSTGFSCFGQFVLQ